MKRMILVLLMTLFLVPAAGAIDGALEINQACVSVGCFNGDSPDFPVELGTTGKYILTSNLEVPDDDTTAIRVEASYVDIDLNGFSIYRTGCNELSCVASLGPGYGVVVYPAATSHTATSVSNGSIIGMGRDGVLIGFGGRVRDLNVSYSGSSGVSANKNSEVSGCTLSNNGFYGIYIFGNSVADGNRVYYNVQGGLYTFQTGTVFRNNVVTGNILYNALYVPAGNTYLGNIMSNYTTFIGPVGGGGPGTDAGGNVCGAGACP